MLNGLRRVKSAIVQLAPFLMNFVRYAWREAREADLMHAFWTPMGAIALLVGSVRKRPVVLSTPGGDLRSLPSAFNRIVVNLSQEVVAVGGPNTEV